MTLEKLLIFGFAIAALMAVTTLGTDIWSDRKSSSGEFEDAIKNFDS